MKKMNNYEAPKAEMIELYMKKDLMQNRFGGGAGDPGMPEVPGSY